MFARSFCGRAGTAVSCSRRVAMPLRAKIQNPAFTQRATMTYAAEIIKELPEDEPEDVLFNTIYGVRTIELNRPKKLHSLNGSMIRKIVPRLQEWTKSDMANVVIIKGTGPKAFCAGGDVATLAEWNMEGEEGMQRSTDYFGLEYKLDHLIATYQKPYIAFMDGITMGGGVGLSIHAPFRIATERTVFAMPETNIGFFPDVGASFFLSRMPGHTGTYLALTSERLKGVNAFYAGIATHYIHSSTLPALESRLAELRFKDYETLDERLKLIDSTIEEFTSGLPHDEPIVLGGEIRKAIDHCFGQSNIPAILRALEEKLTAEDSSPEVKKWAQNTLETIRQRSPTSVYVTLRQLRLGANWSIAETFQREYLLAGKFMRNPDFTEGVNSLLRTKPPKKADWNPATLEDIAASEKDPAEDFLRAAGGERLQLLAQGENADFRTYPHAKYGIPTEMAVRMAAEQQSLTQGQVVKRFVEQRKGKQGIKEVVEEIVKRMTRVDEEGKAVWIDQTVEENKS